MYNKFSGAKRGVHHRWAGAILPAAGGAALDGPVTLTVTVVRTDNAPMATMTDAIDGVGNYTPMMLVTSTPTQTTLADESITSLSPATTTDSNTVSTTTAFAPSSTATVASSTTPDSASPSAPLGTASGDNGQDGGSTIPVKLSAGAIAGIVIGCFVVLLVATVFGMRRRNTQNRVRLRSAWASWKGSRGEREAARQRDVERSMSFVGGPATSLNVRSPVTLEMPQTLPSAYGQGHELPAVADGGKTTAVVVVVVRSFIPSLPDELTISPGERLEIMEEFDDGWAECMNMGGELGMVPMECFDSAAVHRQSRRYTSLARCI